MTRGRGKETTVIQVATLHEEWGGGRKVCLDRSGLERRHLSEEVTFDLRHKGGKETAQVDDEPVPRLSKKRMNFHMSKEY